MLTSTVCPLLFTPQLFCQLFGYTQAELEGCNVASRSQLITLANLRFADVHCCCVLLATLQLFCRLLGYKRAELKGRNVASRFQSTCLCQPDILLCFVLISAALLPTVWLHSG